jgi:hypothetical protein
LKYAIAIRVTTLAPLQFHGILRYTTVCARRRRGPTVRHTRWCCISVWTILPLLQKDKPRPTRLDSSSFVASFSPDASFVPHSLPQIPNPRNRAEAPSLVSAGRLAAARRRRTWSEAGRGNGASSNSSGVVPGSARGDVEATGGGGRARP